MARVGGVTSPADSEEARRLDSLATFAYGLSHDFNNLLGVVLMYNSLLARSSTDPDVEAQLAEVRAVTEEAVDLTRDLLSFAGRTVCSPTVVDVNDLVRVAVYPPEEEPARGDDVELLIHDRPLLVNVDAGHLDRVIRSLLANARDATPDGGTVTVVTSPANSTGPVDQVIVEVRDTGDGMTEDVLSHAIEPFFTTKSHRIGRGLGLSTAYGLVRQNGGSITIDSTLGMGTTVEIRLPALPSGAESS